MQITPGTKAVGLIGHPVEHSFSPILHNHLYDKLELDMVYQAFDVKPDQVAAAVHGMAALGFIGFNITIPYKETVFKLLDDLDPEAEVIGAVNTVRICNGKLTGYNTDGQGFIESLKRSSINITGKRTVILGAGGSARSIGIYMAKERPEAIFIVNRTLEKGEALADLINEYSGIKMAYALSSIPSGVDFIVNTTSVGMWPNIDDNPLYEYSLDNRTAVYDIVYNPRDTAMLRYASGRGAITAGGIGMLIGQGLRAVELWVDRPLPKESWQIMQEVIDRMYR